MRSPLLRLASILLFAAACRAGSGGSDGGAQAEDNGCGVVDFCLPFAGIGAVDGFGLCAYPEATRTAAGAAYAQCISAAERGSCGDVCMNPVRSDGGNPCESCVRAACAAARAACF